MISPSHFSRFVHPHNIWWAVQVIKPFSTPNEITNSFQATQPYVIATITILVNFTASAVETWNLATCRNVAYIKSASDNNHCQWISSAFMFSQKTYSIPLPYLDSPNEILWNSLHGKEFLFEKLTISELYKTLCGHHLTRKLITVFTKPHIGPCLHSVESSPQ